MSTVNKKDMTLRNNDNCIEVNGVNKKEEGHPSHTVRTSDLNNSNNKNEQQDLSQQNMEYLSGATIHSARGFVNEMEQRRAENKTHQQDLHDLENKRKKEDWNGMEDINNQSMTHQYTNQFPKDTHVKKLFKNVLPSRENDMQPFKTLSHANNINELPAHCTLTERNATESGNDVLRHGNFPISSEKSFKIINYSSQWIQNPSKVHNCVNEEENTREKGKQAESCSQSVKCDSKLLNEQSKPPLSSLNNNHQISSGKTFKSIQYGQQRNNPPWQTLTTPPPVPRQEERQRRLEEYQEDLKTTDPIFPSTTPRLRSMSTTQEEVTKFLTQIGYYEKLVKKKFKYFEDICTEEQMLKDFEGEEVCARIIYHLIYNGWRPDTKPPSKNWHVEKLPSEYSVSELYLFLMDHNLRVIASFLKANRVDGPLMWYILQDEILAGQMLPDRTIISKSDFETLRRDFYGTYV